MAGMSRDEDNPICGKHRDLGKAEIRRSEAAVNRTMTSIDEWLNPFTIPNHDILYVLSSGSPVPAEVAIDGLRADEAGKIAKQAFIAQRLQTHEKDFFDKITKLKLLTMEMTNEQTKLTTTQGNAIKYREQGDIAFQILVKSQLLAQPISIDERMTYSITVIPHSLGTPDGFLFKTDKSKIVHYLTDDINPPNYPPNSEIFYIEDGHAFMYTLSDVPPNFKLISIKVLDLLQKNSIMHFRNSVQSSECARRGSSNKLLIEGFNTRKPPDFKDLLNNGENKSQMFDLMRRVWTSSDIAARLVGKTLIIINDGMAYEITSTDGISITSKTLPNLNSKQE